jgi:hypothetical protein
VSIDIPVLDDRNFNDLVQDVKARVPVHSPEWTNLNESDPGITIVELFAFLSENLLYRSNRIPEANRLKFLTMLGVKLQPASPGRGLVTFSNDKGPVQPYLPVPAGSTVNAGRVPFVTQLGLAVLPVSSVAYYKAPLTLEPAKRSKYQLLYQTFLDSTSDVLTFYQPTVLNPPATGKPGPVIDLGDAQKGAIDRSLWLALLAQPGADPDAVRAAIGGQTLSLGVYPSVTSPGQVLAPLSTGGSGVDPGLVFEIAAPDPDPSGMSALGYGVGPPNYRRLPVTYGEPVLQAPGIVQVTLPPYEQILLWDFDPEEEGTGDYPPRLDDAHLSARLVTWIRVRLPPLPAEPSSGDDVQAQPAGGGCGCGGDCMGGTPGQSTSAVLGACAWNNAKAGVLTWVGVNATKVIQAVPVQQEMLGHGTGTPFQAFTVANTPVVVTNPSDFLLEVQGPDGVWAAWQPIDDIYAASTDGTFYTLDPSSGTVTGGSGLFGARFPLRAAVRASYEYGGGPPGEVAIGAIQKSSFLPGGYSVNNPVATWGASLGETATNGEANITRWLRHRDRLVTAQDFSDITRRTPGLNLGRVDVLPLFNPEAADPSSTWPGMVTVMVVPTSDPLHPNAPVPDLTFLNAVCAWLDPRRLVTTEVHVRGPVYRPIWVSVGIEVLPGQVPSLVTQAVFDGLNQFLSPLRGGLPTSQVTAGLVPQAAETTGSGSGWPLNTPVRSQDIEAGATRVPGVRYVDSVLIAAGNPDGSVSASVDPVPMSGLELPAASVHVNVGPPDSPSSLIGGNQLILPTQVPVPVVPETC